MTNTSPLRREVLDGPLYYEMLVGAFESLRSHKDEVNRLNVYPVPDGDTGTNMLLTLESALNRISDPTAALHELVSQSSMGSLMGARGNSGVILSQFFRGIAAVLEDRTAVDAVTLADACRSGVKAAYSAVMRPVEGTILTVAREAVATAEKSARISGDLLTVFEEALEAARTTLERTPELLHVLAEAGVVDAGGQGLIHILEGAMTVLCGESSSNVTVSESEERVDSREKAEHLEFPYDLVFLLTSDDERAYSTDTWEGWGDSLVLVRDEPLIKVHIHTDQPLEVLARAFEFGAVMEVEMHDMAVQVAKNLAQQEGEPLPEELPPGYSGDTGDIAVIPIAMGEGVTRVFQSLGAASVIAGGATMNPSTEDILEAVRASGSTRVVLLPNNSNLILACEQARDMIDVTVDVIPTVSVAQGLAAARAATRGDISGNSLVEEMRRAAGAIQSVEITYAVEDRTFSGIELSEGDVIGFVDGELVAVGSSPVAVLLEILKPFDGQRKRQVAIFVGAGIDPAEMRRLRAALDDELEDFHVDLLPGGQEHYYLVAAVDG
ncbi:MAG: DAK2 domain-containing protein [Clostridia bacterium]